MKKVLLAFLVLLAPAAAQAQSTYNIALVTTQAQDDTLIELVTLRNETTCLRLVNALTCTQAAACVAAGAAGGASCTAAQARAAEARIWTVGTVAGRTEYLEFNVLLPNILASLPELPGLNQVGAARVFPTLSAADRHSVCTFLGRPSTLARPCRLY